VQYQMQKSIPALCERCLIPNSAKGIGASGSRKLMGVDGRRIIGVARL